MSNKLKGLTAWLPEEKLKPTTELEALCQKINEENHFFGVNRGAAVAYIEFEMQKAFRKIAVEIEKELYENSK